MHDLLRGPIQAPLEVKQDRPTQKTRSQDHDHDRCRRDCKEKDRPDMASGVPNPSPLICCPHSI